MRTQTHKRFRDYERLCQLRRSHKLKHHRTGRRQGLATMDTVLIIGSLFPICMVFFYVAQRCLGNLFELVSIIGGSPVM